MECAGQVPDAGQDRRSECFEGADAKAITFATISASAAFVAGIQEAAEFIDFAEVGIDFVQEEGGLAVSDEAEQDGGADVFGAQGARGHGGQNIQGGGFAAAALEGMEVKARCLDEGIGSVAVTSPEGHGIGGAAGQDDVTGVAG